MTYATNQKKRLRSLADKAKVGKQLYELFEHVGEGAMLGTRHAAENSYCLWCEPKGYDHWDDQKEHAPDCKFVSAVAEARRLFK